MSDFFKNTHFNTRMWCRFVAWFYNHEIRYNSKAWLIYDNCHACKKTVEMNYIEYNTFIYKTKQEIMKEL